MQHIWNRALPCYYSEDSDNFPQRGPNGSEKIDGWLILLPGTVKFMSHTRLDANKSTMQHIWNRTLPCCHSEDSDNFASLSRKYRSGHYQKYNRDDVKRTTYRKLASVLNLPKSTVYSIAKTSDSKM